MSEHTPGPWYREDDNAVFTQRTRKIIVDRVQSAADARLIAAAPELLEVARIALEVVGAHTYYGAPGEHQSGKYFGSSGPDFLAIFSFIDEVLRKVEDDDSDDSYDLHRGYDWRDPSESPDRGF